MTKSKILGLMLLVSLSVVMVFSVSRMSAKVDEFHKRSDYPNFRFSIINTRQFSAYDGLAASITDESKDEQAFLRVKFGETDMLVPVKKPPAKDVPHLGIYDEWAKVIEVHETGRTAANTLGDKLGSGRVVLVTRSTPDGYNPETWGTVFRNAWLFNFYEFTPTGTITTSTFRWPRGELGQMSLDRLVAKGNEQAKALAAIPELPERSWQYNTALHVIPKLNVPKYRFKDTAVHAMGWTLPTAGFAGLGAIIGLLLVIAPARVKSADAGESFKKSRAVKA